MRNMVNGNVILFDDYKSEKYKIKAKYFLPELTGKEIYLLEEKGLIKKIDEPRLLAIEMSIFGNYEQIIPTVIAAHKPERANAYEGGDELIIGNEMRISGYKSISSKLLVLAIQYYQIEE